MYTTTYRTAAAVNDAMIRVYNYMTVSIIISALVAMFVSSTPALMAFFFDSWVKWVVIFAPIALIFIFIPALNANPPRSVALLMLYVFAGLMGLSLSVFFAVYTATSLVMAFVSSAVLFGTMSLYGYFTKQSLESLGQFMLVGLIAIIIASIVNLFIGSSLITTVISAIAVIIFLGLTAYDTQKIREMVQYETSSAIEVMGALSLYMDFVNIFINLLQLFGGKKD